MQVKEVKKLENSLVELTIEVKGEEFKNAVDAAFKKNIAKITVPGFRKGKAPRKVVERMYGEGVFFEDAVNALYPDAYDAAVKEADLKVVACPEIEITEVDAEGFSFKAVVTVKPEVTVKEYKGLKATKTVYTVTESEVKAELERLQKQNERTIVVERESKDGDTVNINFDGSVDGVHFDGGKGENYDLVLGSNSFIPGFEPQLVGKKAGEDVKVEVTFPEEYHAEELKGKAAIFDCHINEVKETEVPELDDEFAKDVSEFDTLADLKKDIKKKIKERKDAQSANELDNALIDALLEQTEVAIPDAMIQAAVDNKVAEFEQRLAGSGLNMQMYLQYTGMDEAAFRKGFEEDAEKQTKVRLALEKVVELAGVVVAEEDIEKEYSDIAAAYGMPVDQVKMYLPKEDITMDCAVSKAVELIRNNAEVTEEKATAKKTATKKPAAKSEGEKKPAAKKPAAKKTT
ncbi:MAG: trigger factor, partial [Clostridia bacterium]|nr:trigger factor [Clostridia bacterium]